MSLGTLLVHVHDKPQSKQQLNVAIRLALDFDARLGGIKVIGQPEGDQPDFRFLEELAQTVALSAGRPTLIIPYGSRY